MDHTRVRHTEDADVERRLSELKYAIQKWAEENEVSDVCTVRDYLDSSGTEPFDPPVLAVVCYDGMLLEALNGYSNEELEQSFSDLLLAHGCWYERDTGSTAWVLPNDGSDYSAYAAYFHWKWICSLVEDDVADVYEELYKHFEKRPDDLYNLHWREYDVILARLFQAQGFDVELGKGTADEGVDIRLVKRDPIGDIVTLVQAKKYSKSNKIDQSKVAALYGVQKSENASSSIFVTTSTYAPVAKRFAARELVKGELFLAESAHVAKWCSLASDGIIRDKSLLLSRSNVLGLLTLIGERRDPRLVKTSFGYNSTHNQFALVVKESKYAALLMPIPKRTISDDGYGQRGLEVPRFDHDLPHFNAENVIRVRKKQLDGDVTYWSGDRIYRAWNGEACHFDYYD